MIIKLAAVFAAISLVFSLPGLADSAIQTANELRTMAAQLSVEDARLKVVQKRLEVAKARKEISIQLKDAAKSDVEAEEARRLLGVPSIVVHDARVEVAREATKFCKADNFLAYTCHRKMDCEFLADRKLCSLPAAETEPMVLKVNFECGTQIRNVVVPINQQAYLTCK